MSNNSPKFREDFVRRAFLKNRTDMPNTKDYFKKAGGVNLLRQYVRNGALGTAVMQFLLLGKSRTALELLRLSAALKTKQHLYKRYSNVLRRFDAQWVDSALHVERRTVWLCWWQGEDAMPELVKRCYVSVRENLKDWEIVLLTEKNYREYVQFPDFILDKFQKGMITHAHFSDLLRLELLIRFGGLWIDATVLCTSSNIPMSILNSDLFVFRPQKPGADGKATSMSNWLIWAKSNNHILQATQTLLYDYWKRNDCVSEYFIFHHFMTIVMERYPEEAKKIPPFCNSVPHILQLHLFDPFDEVYWNDLKQMTCFHKLTYKLNIDKSTTSGTFYEMIINNKI